MPFDIYCEVFYYSVVSVLILPYSAVFVKNNEIKLILQSIYRLLKSLDIFIFLCYNQLIKQAYGGVLWIF